jgi:hypothetical protein
MQSPALVVSLDQYDIDAVHEWCRTAHVFRRHRPIEFNGHYEIDADAVREARWGRPGRGVAVMRRGARSVMAA